VPLHSNIHSSAEYRSSVANRRRLEQIELSAHELQALLAGFAKLPAANVNRPARVVFNGVLDATVRGVRVNEKGELIIDAA